MVYLCWDCQIFRPAIYSLYPLAAFPDVLPGCLDTDLTYPLIVMMIMLAVFIVTAIVTLVMFCVGFIFVCCIFR